MSKFYFILFFWYFESTYMFQSKEKNVYLSRSNDNKYKCLLYKCSFIILQIDYRNNFPFQLNVITKGVLSADKRLISGQFIYFAYLDYIFLFFKGKLSLILKESQQKNRFRRQPIKKESLHQKIIITPVTKLRWKMGCPI